VAIHQQSEHCAASEQQLALGISAGGIRGFIWIVERHRVEYSRRSGSTLSNLGPHCQTGRPVIDRLQKQPLKARF